MMTSIRNIYKIGHGPSSSHTMGPVYASTYFKALFPHADEFKVTLYGSLALTGKGHLTDVSIKQALEPIKTTVEFDYKNKKIEHPNTMGFSAYHRGELLETKRFFSVGGGNLVIKGQKNAMQEKSIYPHRFLNQIIEFCKKHNWRLIDYIKKYEPAETWTHLHEVWKTMDAAIGRGLNATSVLPGILQVQRKARQVLETKANVIEEMGGTIRVNRMVMAYAYATSEENASGGIIVTAPTCGASGVLPAVLLYAMGEFHLSEEVIIEALAVAGLIGNLAKTNGSISGAEAGCQAEVGVACCMGAAAYAHLKNLSNERINNAATMAMEHHLGLTCDPVMGYVQIPCIERNAVAAIQAIVIGNLAAMLDEPHLFNYDDIIAVMLETGKSLKAGYRETSKSGLAKIYANKLKLKK